VTRRSKGDIRADRVAVVLAFTILVVLVAGAVAAGLYVMHVGIIFMEDR
jgi:hypothetical protein